MQSEVVPQVAALTANVGKITSQLHALEEVLIVLLETKEEQARQEWAARKERELNEQKNRFLSVARKQGSYVSESHGAALEG